MDKKKILKVSFLTGVVSYLVWLLFAMINIGRHNLYVPLILTFVMTGFVLNKKLKKDDYGIVLGMVIASFVVLVLHLLFFGLYLDFLFDLLPF